MRPRAFLEGEGKGQLDLPQGAQGRICRRAVCDLRSVGRQHASGRDSGAARIEDEQPPVVEISPAQKVAIAMAALLIRIERESQGRVRICRSVGDIEHCMKTGVLAAVLHMEGAEAIDANFELLDVLHQAGLRSLGPVWSRPNIFGHGVPFRIPSSPDTGPGLTDLGKELIRACNRLKILIDLSHLNEKGFWDVAALSDAPLVASHSNAHALCPHARNLTDRQCAAIRESGGFVGVNYATSFLRPDGRRDADTPVELVIDHVEHFLKLLGEDGVGFGSDFDGAMVPAGIGDAAGVQSLVKIMRQRGYGKELIEKLCFKNWLRVLERTWTESTENPGAATVQSAPEKPHRSLREVPEEAASLPLAITMFHSYAAAPSTLSPMNRSSVALVIAAAPAKRRGARSGRARSRPPPASATARSRRAARPG